MKGRSLVAWNLRRLRLEKGISQEGLAADAEIDRAYLSELERKLGNASVDLLDRLALALEAHPSEFFREPWPDAKRLKPLRVGRRPNRK